MMKPSLALIQTALLSALGGNLPAAEFVEIGPDLAASSVSDDGRVVVGRRPRGNAQAYLWTRSSGFRMLGTLHADSITVALDVSADGTVVVGSSGGEPFVWTEHTGMVGLGFLPGYDVGNAFAVSADGSTVVGELRSNSPDFLRSAFRWTQEDGFVELIPPGMDRSSDPKVSADGNVIVGRAYKFGPHGPGAGFIWDEIRGFQGFGPIPQGWPSAFPHVVSADGSVVFGGENGLANHARRAFRWTAQEGIQPIPGFSESRPLWSSLNDATPDGSILVGSTYAGGGGETARASIWDLQHGTRDLRDVLISEHGFAEEDLPTLPVATGISADAKTIIGSPLSENQGGWVIYLDKPLVAFVPNVAYADYRPNGLIDGADFLAWQRGESPTPLGDDNLKLWESQYGTTVPASAGSAVPEPRAAVLLIVAICCVAVRR